MKPKTAKPDKPKLKNGASKPPIKPPPPTSQLLEQLHRAGKIL